MHRIFPLLGLVFLASCAAPPPQLDAPVAAELRAQDYPDLIPLGPVSDIDALLPEDPARAGLTLLARAADLRRRAAALQAMSLN